MSSKISLHKTSQCGGRPTNEDVERYFLNLEDNGSPTDKSYAPVDIFIVCDGHGGKEVAEFVAPKLEKKLINKNMQYPLDNSVKNKIFNDIQNALIQHPNKIANECGCTCLTMIRYISKNGHEYVQLLNIGDCRAVLSKNGVAMALTKDHKPIWPDEKKRIDAVNDKHGTNEEIHFDGGDWRIGDLSVSRSFGDLDNTPFVTHKPDSFNFRLDSYDEFIIMGCDGLWDTIENHEAVNFVRDHMDNDHIKYYNIPHKYPSEETAKSKNIARKLASYAIARGSTDNVSVFIIFLK